MSTFKGFIIAQSFISKFRFTPKSKPNLKSQKRHVTNRKQASLKSFLWAKSNLKPINPHVTSTTSLQIHKLKERAINPLSTGKTI